MDIISAEDFFSKPEWISFSTEKDKAEFIEKGTIGHFSNIKKKLLTVYSSAERIGRGRKTHIKIGAIREGIVNTEYVSKRGNGKKTIITKSAIGIFLKYLLNVEEKKIAGKEKLLFGRNRWLKESDLFPIELPKYGEDTSDIYLKTTRDLNNLIQSISRGVKQYGLNFEHNYFYIEDKKSIELPADLLDEYKEIGKKAKSRLGNNKGQLFSNMYMKVFHDISGIWQGWQIDCEELKRFREKYNQTDFTENLLTPYEFLNKWFYFRHYKAIADEFKEHSLAALKFSDFNNKDALRKYNQASDTNKSKMRREYFQSIYKFDKHWMGDMLPGNMIDFYNSRFEEEREILTAYLKKYNKGVELAELISCGLIDRRYEIYLTNEMQAAGKEAMDKFFW